MSNDANAIAMLIHSLIHEVNELRKVQDQALQDVVFVGSTDEERVQYENRGERIKELQGKLSQLLGQARGDSSSGT